MLRIMPFIEGDTLGRNWQWSYGISNTANTNTLGYFNLKVASMDVKGFYCPTRRNAFRKGTDDAMMPGTFTTYWATAAAATAGVQPGGGTDYGGCAGRHLSMAWNGRQLCGPMTYGMRRRMVSVVPGITFPNANYVVTQVISSTDDPG